jgi:anti-sigma factor RsiW
MTCPIRNTNPEVLLDYCSRRLDADAMARLEAHMALCPSCRAELASQQALWEALDDWEALPVSREFDARLYARIEEQNQDLFLTRWWRRLFAAGSPASWKPAFSVAMAMVVVLGIGLLRAPAPVESVLFADGGEELRIDAVEVEQAERTLEDLDMLTLITPAKQGAEQGQI